MASFEHLWLSEATWAAVAGALKGTAPALENHLWQSTMFALAAGLLALALRRNHARARYWIWMAASLKFVLPFALLAAMGSHLARPRVVAEPAQQTMYFAVEDFSEPFAAPLAPMAAPVAASNPWRTEVVVPLALAVVWLAGFVAVLGGWCVRWRRVARAIRKAAPMLDGREVDALRRIEQAGGVKRKIALRLSQSAMEPGVFGIVRPVLAWPAGISARLDDAQLDAVLAHEVCHVRRRDNLTAALHLLVEAAFWFHPLVWWLGARLLAERERACDEAVLLVCTRPQAYAESILKVCEFCVESPVACVSGVTGADLKQRVMQIMTGHAAHRLTLAKKLLLAVAALCAVAAPVLLGQAQAARRMMLAAADAAPKPFRTAAHAMIAVEQTPSTGLIAEAQVDGAVPYAATQAATAEQAQGSVPHGINWVALQQPDAPAQLCCGAGSFEDVVSGVRVNSKSDKRIFSFRLGWAYMPGLEFHVGDTIVPYNGMPPHGTYGVPDQHVDSRGRMTGVLVFLEQVRLDDGTDWQASHKEIEASVTRQYSRYRVATFKNFSNSSLQSQLSAQTADAAGKTARPAFEAATVKPNVSDCCTSSKMSVDQMLLTHETLKNLIVLAYAVQPYQVVAPDWMENVRFDITAKYPPGTKYDDRWPMLRTLLEDRFGLQVHRDTKEMTGYSLVVASGGFKLKPSEPGEGNTVGGNQGNVWTFRAYKVGMPVLAWELSDSLGEVVVDKTGLGGEYDYTLRWANNGPTNPGAADTDAPSVFTALEDTLGLKLQHGKVQVDVIVVDHAERAPTEN